MMCFWDHVASISTSFLGALLGGSTALMALSITLVALVPTLIEIARTRSADYFKGEDSRQEIRTGLSRLRYTIFLYGGVIILSTIGMFLPTSFQVILGITLILVSLLFLTGTLILISVSYALTVAALEVI